MQTTLKLFILKHILFSAVLAPAIGLAAEGSGNGSDSDASSSEQAWKNSLECIVCCSYITESLKDLLAHNLIHAGVRPLSPELQTDLSHDQLHLQEFRSYSPGEDDSGSLESSSKRASKIIHVCRYCGYVALRPSALIMHERIHTGEKPYECPFCLHTATQKGNLKRHIRQKHVSRTVPNIRMLAEAAPAAKRQRSHAEIEDTDLIPLLPELPPDLFDLHDLYPADLFDQYNPFSQEHPIEPNTFPGTPDLSSNYIEDLPASWVD